MNGSAAIKLDRRHVFELLLALLFPPLLAIATPSCILVILENAGIAGSFRHDQ